MPNPLGVNSPVTELTISRKVWIRGDSGPGGSCLYRVADEKMCCVGVYLRALGTPLDKLTGKMSASVPSVRGVLPESALWLVDETGWNSDGAFSLYETNDFLHLSEPEREAKIAELFLKHGGVTVTFVD